MKPSHELGGLLAMWSGFSLAFLTKGPPGLLPFIAFFAFCVLTRGWRAASRLFPPAGIFLFALIGLSWYLAVIIADPQRLTYFVGHEFFERLFTSVHGRNSEWYGFLKVYLPVFLVGTCPWLFFVWPSAWRSLAHLRLGTTWQQMREKDPSRLLLVLWILVPMCVFIIARSRLPLYPLPLFVPLSLLISRALSHRLSRLKMAKVLGITVVGLLAVKCSLGLIPIRKDVRPLAAFVHGQVPEPIDEVIVVNRKNLYGLSLYLGADIEHVAISEQDLKAGTYDRIKTLAVELQDPGPNRAILVPDYLASSVVTIANDLGYDPARRDSFRDLALFWLPGQGRQDTIHTGFRELATINRYDRQRAATINKKAR
jgi:4-amino-4-deoxy-L-arabinose transferase